jgi:hypothetical protein
MQKSKDTRSNTCAGYVHTVCDKTDAACRLSSMCGSGDAAEMADFLCSGSAAPDTKKVLTSSIRAERRPILQSNSGAESKDGLSRLQQQVYGSLDSLGSW